MLAFNPYDLASGASSIRPQFQPKVELATRVIVGYEAFLRVQHGLSAVPNPVVFAAIAQLPGDDFSRIHQVIFERVLSAAVKASGKLDAPVAVNVPPHLLMWVECVQWVATAARSMTHPLSLELIAIGPPVDYVTVQRNMGLLGREGVRFALDGLGGGDSSLARLARLAVNEVKVDAALINSERGRIIFRHIVEASLELGAAVTAEGVEDAEMAAHVQDAGATHAQGYFFGPPAEISANA